MVTHFNMVTKQAEVLGLNLTATLSKRISTCLALKKESGPCVRGRIENTINYTKACSLQWLKFLDEVVTYFNKMLHTSVFYKKSLALQLRARTISPCESDSPRSHQQTFLKNNSIPLHQKKKSTSMAYEECPKISSKELTYY